MYWPSHGGTGLQEAFGLVYAENVVVHILNGKAYSRAVRAHLLMDAALCNSDIRSLRPALDPHSSSG